MEYLLILATLGGRPYMTRGAEGLEKGGGVGRERGERGRGKGEMGEGERRKETKGEGEREKGRGEEKMGREKGEKGSEKGERDSLYPPTLIDNTYARISSSQYYMGLKTYGQYAVIWRFHCLAHVHTTAISIPALKE